MNMNEMTLNQKQAVMKTIQVLNNFIQKRRHSTLMDNTRLRIMTVAGEEIEIYTAAEAEKCKDRMFQMLELERLYSK